VRRAVTPDGREFTLADTVGFVRQLPTQLVEAFRSTLEEVSQSDLVLHVVDGAHPDPEGQLSAVRTVLAEVGGDKVPELIVINKCDAADPDVLDRLLRREKRSIAVSAKTGQGIPELIERLAAELPRPDVDVQVLVPFSRGDLVNRIHQEGDVLVEEHTGEGTRINARVDSLFAAELAGFSAAAELTR
jgi:GTP-binding protein HflX